MHCDLAGGAWGRVGRLCAVSSLLVGCTLDLGASSLEYACTDSSQCAAGYVCVGGTCAHAGTTASTGSPHGSTVGPSSASASMGSASAGAATASSGHSGAVTGGSATGSPGAGSTHGSNSGVAASSAGTVSSASSHSSSASTGTSGGSRGSSSSSSTGAGSSTTGSSSSGGCPPGLTSCPDGCIDTQIDPGNCGGCGDLCQGGTYCDAGGCACPAGDETCSGTCSDPLADGSNCGTCGNSCQGGMFCDAGGCVCPSAEIACAGTCIDPLTDDSACGSCTTTCDTSTGYTCQAGSCACTSPFGLCGGACVDLLTDPTDCGTCGVVCNAVPCNSGKCAAIASPADIPGLALWLDGADPSAVVIDGGLVAAWLDKGPNGLDLYSPPDGGAPAWVMGAGLAFHANAYVQRGPIPGLPVGASDRTAFVVASNAAPAVTTAVFSYGNPAVTGDKWGLDAVSGDIVVSFAGGELETTSVPWPTASPVAVSIVSYTPMGSLTPVNNAYFDGRFIAQIAPTTYDTVPDAGLAVGGDSVTLGDYEWNGNLMEIIIYDEALSPEQQAEVQNYLGAKWGVVISLSDGGAPQ